MTADKLEEKEAMISTRKKVFSYQNKIEFKSKYRMIPYTYITV